MLKVFFAASTILIAVSGMAQASVSMLDDNGLVSTNSQSLNQNTMGLKVYADNDRDGNDGEDDNDGSGCDSPDDGAEHTGCHG
jgi:hypothetical protein